MLWESLEDNYESGDASGDESGGNCAEWLRAAVEEFYIDTAALLPNNCPLCRRNHEDDLERALERAMNELEAATK